MKWKPLLLCHLFVLFLLASFLWPPTRHFWDIFDVAAFKFLNNTLKDHPSVQLFWAFVNHKRADLVEDAIFLLFFTVAIVKAPKEMRLRRAAQFLFCVILAASVNYFITRTLLREHFLIPRESPSLVVTPCVRLSQEIPWLLIKDETLASFPGDHATTLFLFAALYTLFAGKRLGLYACAYAAFRCLPRLIIGAHWVSDLLVGTSSLVLLVLSWVLCTPLHRWIIDTIEKLFIFLKRPRHEKEKPI